MRINDILTETRSDEGIVSDIGTGVGKAAGATARGIGAVAGGVRGVWDAAKQGFQAGRNVVGGGGANNANTQKAQTLRAQADQLDGGNSAQQMPSPQSGGGGRRNSGAGGQSRPYTGGGQNTTTNAAPASNNAAAAGPDAAMQKLQKALQHIKGPDIERIRTMLKKRAGIAEGILSKAAGGLGKMNRGYVNAKSAYQQGRGGDMTPQEIDLAIASMPKEQAAEILNFFDTLYPAGAAGSPADTGAPTNPGPEATTDPAASSTLVPPPGGAAGAGAAGAGAAAKGFGTPAPAPSNVSFNLPKAPAAAKPVTPAPQVRQTVPNPPKAKMDIKGLPVRNMGEGRNLHVHSSFLGMDL